LAKAFGVFVSIQTDALLSERVMQAMGGEEEVGVVEVVGIESVAVDELQW
jgi:hypothetical protein